MPNEGNPFAPNPNFLKKHFRDIDTSTEVAQAARRSHIQEGKGFSEAKSLSRIQNYLDRLNEIVLRKNPKEKERGLSAIKRLLYRTAVITPENIPDSYWDLQKRIAREQGHGDIEVSQEQKNQLAEVLIADQKSSLDTWVDYFASPDAMYPDWLKYWATRNVIGMGEYDKEKHEFKRRSKGTVKPFPDLNREALAYVLDALQKKYAKQKINLDRFEEADQQKFNDLLKTESFPKLYAWAIEKVNPVSKELLKTTEGRWVKYEKGSDPAPLVAALQGHGTGWCTAGEATAQIQLKSGDFYVYYSMDEQGKPTIPRAAIRMQQRGIAEVRGIAENQNLDPYIGDIVQKKMMDFPDGRVYEKKAADMKLLTAIEKKSKRHEELSLDELAFLWETASAVEGFGYGADPRLKEIRSTRDELDDVMKIFHVQEDEVCDAVDPILTDRTKILFHWPGVITPQTPLPRSLVYGAGDLCLEGVGFSAETADTLIRIKMSRVVVRHLFAFQHLRLEHLHTLIQEGFGHEIAAYPVCFEGIAPEDVALRLIDAGCAYSVAMNLRSYGRLSSTVANKLIDANEVESVLSELDIFEGLDHWSLAQSLVESGDGHLIMRYLFQFHFSSKQRNELFNKLIDSKQIDLEEIANWQDASWLDDRTRQRLDGILGSYTPYIESDSRIENQEGD